MEPVRGEDVEYSTTALTQGYPKARDDNCQQQFALIGFALILT
jgi:hypothetical protein